MRLRQGRFARDLSRILVQLLDVDHDALCINEVLLNLSYLPRESTEQWRTLRRSLHRMDDLFTLDRPSIFGPAKDRPILFGALAWAEVLLTLDQDDFGPFMDKPFYGLAILNPGAFLERERNAGRLK